MVLWILVLCKLSIYGQVVFVHRALTEYTDALIGLLPVHLRKYLHVSLSQVGRYSHYSGGSLLQLDNLFDVVCASDFCRSRLT